jgi:hypothetical protein
MIIVDDFPIEIVNGWRVKLGVAPIPKDELDYKHKIGVINIDHALCFCCVDFKGKNGLVALFTKNPEAPKELVSKGLDFLINEALKILKKDGVTQVMAMSSLDGFNARLQRHGFNVLETNVTHLGKEI